MRRKVLAAAAATSLAAAVLAIPASSAAAPPGATTQAKHGPVTPGPTITLLTGDTVRLDKAADGTPTGTVIKDVGPQGDIVFQQMNGDLYALNGQVIRLIGQGRLDRQLFDLTLLAKDGYDDAHTAQLPVITTYKAGYATPKAAPGWAAGQRALPSIRSQAEGVRKDSASGALADLTRSDSAVQKVWLDAMAHISLDVTVPAVGAPSAWASGYTGKGVKVAVVDSGVDATHPDLQGRIVAQHRFVDGDPNDADDDNGHGTHVASTVAGTGAASGGKYRGVAPDADLVIAKVCDGAGNCPDSAIIAGMQWAADQGAKIINLSLGGLPTDGTDPMSQALNQISDASGALFVVAAGNEHEGSVSDNTPMVIDSPGSADRALTVGAMSKVADANGQRHVAWYSSWGPRLGDLAVKPEIAAPGGEPVSEYPSTAADSVVAARAAHGHEGTTVDQYYTAMAGTSMATPHVAGGAVLLAQEHPDWTRDQLKDALVSAADPTADLKTDKHSTVVQQGGGMLDLKQATANGLVATGTLNLGQFEAPYSTATGTVTFRNPGTTAVHADLKLDLFQMDKTLTTETAVDPGDAVTVSPSTMDVPAGGTATATVTVNLPDAGLAVGSYYGYVEAAVAGADTVRTTIGFTKDVQRAKLTVRGTDRNGVPETTTYYSFVNLMDLETGQIWPGWYDNGVASFDALGADPRLPVGRYAVLSNIAGFPVDPPYWYMSDTIGGDPELNLTKDTTVNIDARQGRPVRFKTDRPTEEAGDVAETMQWQRVVGPEGDNSILGEILSAKADLYVIPGGGTVQTGTFTMKIQDELVAPTLTMAAHGAGAPRTLNARYAHEGGGCDAYLPCVAPFRSPGEYRVVDAGTGTPDELAAAKVTGKVALVHEVEPDPNDPPNTDTVTTNAAAAGASGVLVVIGDAGPNWRVSYDHTTIPVAVLSHAEGELLAAAVKAGPVTITTGGQAISPYVYNLNQQVTGKLPDNPTFAANPQTLATVTARYHADTPDAIYTVSGSVWGVPTRVKAPYVRTEYVSPGAQGWFPWISRFDGGGQFDELSYTNPTLSAGQRVTADYVTGPIAPGWSSELTATDGTSEHYMGFGYLNEYPIGATGREINASFGEPVHLRYLHNGQVLCDYTNIQTCFLPGDPGLYQLELDTTNPHRQTSTSTHTVWEVNAAFTPGSAPLAMVALAYDVPLDLLNSVTGGAKYTATIKAANQGDYHGNGPFTLQAWASNDDGKTWTALGSHQTDQAGDARFDIRTPKGAKAVTLRVKATDSQGNSVDQTIYDAWNVH